MSDTARRVVITYTLIWGLFTLGASLIWAINTIFLIRVGGLDLFQAMLVNSVFTVGQMVFEVPTGVVADTVGRRACVMLAMLTLSAATLLYMFTPGLGLGFFGFALASVLLGLGYSFQTGALDAWMVDALDASDWSLPKDRVFARGQIAASAAIVVGSLLGGLLGQVNLLLPYGVRAVVLMVCFVVAAIVMRDVGFEPRPLRMATFGKETRAIFDAGVRYGVRSSVVRPLLFVSGISGLFFMYGWYAWQPYILELLGRDYVWLLGAVQAASSLAGIVGNAVVGRYMGSGENRRDPSRVLTHATLLNALLVLGIGAVGIVWARPGILPAAVAIALWLLWGFVYAVSTPVRMSYINEHIPSSQRATVLSLDAFFVDTGGAVGQPALGWLSDRVSISFAWVVGALLVAVTAPLYELSGRAVAEGLSESNRGS